MIFESWIIMMIISETKSIWNAMRLTDSIWQIRKCTCCRPNADRRSSASLYRTFFLFLCDVEEMRGNMETTKRNETINVLNVCSSFSSRCHRFGCFCCKRVLSRLSLSLLRCVYLFALFLLWIADETWLRRIWKEIKYSATRFEELLRLRLRRLWWHIFI